MTDVTMAPVAAADARALRARRTLHRRAVALTPLISLAILFALLSFASDAFLSKTNLLNLLETNTAIGIAACAGTLVLVTGCLDVSVGAIYALAAILTAKVVIATGSVPLGLAAGLAGGGLMGLVNGLIVTAGAVNSFVATLATGIMFLSGAQALANGELLTPKPAAFTTLGRDAALGVKYSIVLFALTAFVTGLLLARWRYGRHATVVGTNEHVARLSGVPVWRVRCWAFVVSGVAAALAGLVATSRDGQIEANIGGTTYLLQVIAAIAIGGTSLRGGEGAVWRTVVGVLFLGLVNNGLALLNVDPTYYGLFTGLLILAAVGGQALGHKLQDGG
jgi:ribose transport system permease protein